MKLVITSAPIASHWKAFQMEGEVDNEMVVFVITLPVHCCSMFSMQEVNWIQCTVYCAAFHLRKPYQVRRVGNTKCSSLVC